MFARNIKLHLKPNSGAEFTRTVETEILPLLRKQTGFKDEMTLLGANGVDAVSISVWERQENADTYARDAYPEVLKSLAKVVDGTPEIGGFEVANSTFHRIAARV